MLTTQLNERPVREEAPTPLVRRDVPAKVLALTLGCLGIIKLLPFPAPQQDALFLRGYHCWRRRAGLVKCVVLLCSFPVNR